MKLPGVAIAASFGCGIVIGLVPAVSQRAGTRGFLAGGLLLSSLLVLTGISLAYFQKLFWAGAISLACWAVLGVVAAGMEQQPRAGDHVLTLAEAGKIDLKSPLRWYGRMRDEPARLPWGWGYEIALSGVDAEGSFVPLRGGLRFSFTAQPGKTVPVDLHIGDEVAVLAQAKLPQVYRDEGAFDRREYLRDRECTLRESYARQNCWSGYPRRSPRLNFGQRGRDADCGRRSRRSSLAIRKPRAY